MKKEIHLPELGDGISAGTIAALSVEVGAVLAANDAIFEIETEKAVLPVPIPCAGTLLEWKVATGDTVAVGQVVAVVEVGDSKTSPEASPEAETKTEEPVPTPNAESDLLVCLPEMGDGISSGTVAAVCVSVGDDIKEGDALLEIETEKAVLPMPSPFSGRVVSIAVAVGATVKVGQEITVIRGKAAYPVLEAKTELGVKSEDPAPYEISNKKEDPASPKIAQPNWDVAPAKSVLAGPAARRLARELGVDLTHVHGSGKGGRISGSDIREYMDGFRRQASGHRDAPVMQFKAPSDEQPPLPDFSKFGSIRKEPLSNLRKVIAKRMSHSWQTIPHVFQFQDIDLSSVVRMQQAWSEKFKSKGSSASPTNFFIKALASCLLEFPQFNSSLDMENGQLIYKEFVNIGVAVDTPSGLIVPVLKHVDKLNIFEIGLELRELAARTRERKVTPEEMSGASMTLSNLGGIGGSYFTPIVNWPEVAIMGVGKTEVKPVYVEGKFVPRSVATVCLSYDHRVIDGADGARFVARFKDIMENMERTLLGG